MLSRFAVLLFWVPVAAQKLTAFDAASASSVYSTKSFGADLATLESSGCSCCSAQWCKGLLSCFVSCARYWCSAGSGDLGKAACVITLQCG